MRLRYLPVYTDVLMELWKGNALPVTCVENRIPKDARVVRIGHDHLGALNIVIESTEFADVDEGAEIPMHPRPLFRRVDPLSLPEGL